MEQGQNSPKRRRTFKKTDRLLRRSDYLYLAEKGQRFTNRYFIAYAIKNSASNCRLGVTVTRKAGNAVTRNRLKRQAREYFRQNRHIVKFSWDIVLIAKRQAADIPNSIAAEAIESIFSKIASQALP
ncbi:MAG: ribonuclease P protein component [Desulfobacteraceae bacterium]|nr:ribonuclease P protein component [Desulfobacteraceae bacterium]